MLQLNASETKFSIDICFAIVHYFVREESISEKNSYLLTIPADTKQLFYSVFYFWSSVRVNYKYIEVHRLSFENAIFFVALTPLTRNKILTV